MRDKAASAMHGRPGFAGSGTVSPKPRVFEYGLPLGPKDHAGLIRARVFGENFSDHQEWGYLKIRRGDGWAKIIAPFARTTRTEDLLAVETPFRIHPVNPEAWNKERPLGERRKLVRTIFELDMPDQEGRLVRVTWPMIMHRPFPPALECNRLTVATEFGRPKWRWFVRFGLYEPGVLEALSEVDGIEGAS